MKKFHIGTEMFNKITDVFYSRYSSYLAKNKIFENLHIRINRNTFKKIQDSIYSNLKTSGEHLWKKNN